MVTSVGTINVTIKEKNILKRLVGKTVLEIYAGYDCLVFTTQDGYLKLTTWAECCSHTWFTDIQNPEAILNRMITEVSTDDLPPEFLEHDDRGEVDELYGFTLKSIIGTCSVAFRNSSNGYYGGNLDELQEFSCKFNPEGYQRISKDWRSNGYPNCN